MFTSLCMSKHYVTASTAYSQTLVSDCQIRVKLALSDRLVAISKVYVRIVLRSR